MDPIDWSALDSFEFPDELWAARDRIDERVAAAIGWDVGKPNEICWYDRRGEFTGFYNNERPSKEKIESPQFSPSTDTEPALVAAAHMADKKGFPFSLHRDNAGNWRASFITHKAHEVSAVSHLPTRAICDAIVKADAVKTPDELFAKKS